MTDRELLELAAKAAGFCVRIFPGDVSNGIPLWIGNSVSVGSHSWMESEHLRGRTGSYPRQVPRQAQSHEVMLFFVLRVCPDVQSV